MHNHKMRPRSKSVSLLQASFEEDDEVEDDASDLASNCSDQENARGSTAKPKGTTSSSWTAAEQLTLLCQVKGMIPKVDSIPYDARLEEIDWRKVQVKNHSQNDSKTEFDRLVNSTRTFRLLNEIIREKHAEILPELGLERPAASFAIFMRENKKRIEELAKTDPQIGKYTQLGAKLFSECSEEERSRYRERARIIKEKYLQEIAKYELPPGLKKEQKGTTKGKFTPCALYIQSKVLEDANASKSDLRADYATLPKDKKLTWILRWLGLKHGEKANLGDYLKCQKCLSKQEMDIWDEYEKRPRLVTGYNLFMKETVGNKSSNNSTHRENFKSSTEAWRNLPKVERAPFESAAKKMKLNFTADFTRFVASLPLDRHDYEISMLTDGRRKNTHKWEAKVSSNERNSDMIASTEHKKGMKAESEDENSSYDYVDDDQTEFVFQCETASAIKEFHNSQSSDEHHEVSEKLKSPMKRGKQMLHSTPHTKVHAMPDPGPSNMKIGTSKGKLTSSPRKTVNEEKSRPVSKTKGGRGDKKSADVEMEKAIKQIVKMPEPNFASPSAKKSRAEMVPNPKIIKSEPVSDSAEEAPATKLKKRTIEETVSTSVFKKFKDNNAASSDHSIDSVTPTSKENTSSEARQAMLNKKFRKIAATKPPETLQQYYADTHFQGVLKKAKKSYKLLDSDEKSELASNYERAKEKYRKKFAAFAQNLWPKELSQFSDEF